ncbi:MAG TPA: methionine--tRNA ligase [Candidatus Binataceae bacterium]|nr:methionine--tRNA ligase [Candidatus Binataceae bacterium]
MPQRVHITTAIFYCNGAPHVGSAYEALAADVFARYQRRRVGREQVTFLSGTDEHGDKIRRAALAQGLAPKVYTDQMSELFRAAFAGLNVSFDYWVRTTDPVHEKFVQAMLTRTYARGDIYFRDYAGLYCVDCERFYTEKELLPDSICPVHNKKVELINEGNYFLKIDKYREAVLRHIHDHPDFIRPERYRNEALNMLAEPLADLCISRPKTRMDWGIEIPFDDRYVTYVWYDAFWTYVSKPATDSGDIDRYMREVFPHTEHFIGKDILKTHAVYWPPMVLAAGFDGLFFKHLNVHGWLNFGGSRMSKSSGNVRDPVAYEQSFGPDVLRYFVMREMAYGLDGDFSEERLTERYNADLANNLGNLVSRVLTMARNYFSSEIKSLPTDPSLLASLDVKARPKFGDPLGPTPANPAIMSTLTSLHQTPPIDIGPPGYIDLHLCGVFTDQPATVGKLVDQLSFNRALEEIWKMLDFANKYVAMTVPFTLFKTDPARVQVILANLTEAVRVLANTLEPFMPVTAQKIFAMLNVDEETARKPYGEGLKLGHKVNPPVALFPRIEKAKA